MLDPTGIKRSVPQHSSTPISRKSLNSSLETGFYFIPKTRFDFCFGSIFIIRFRICADFRFEAFYSFYFLVRPPFRPLNFVLDNPVMRAALKIPISNRRVQTNTLAIINKLPAIARKIGYNLISTATTTIVRRNTETN